MNKYGKQTSVDYCGNEKFQFATATVLFEQKKELKAEVKKVFELDCENKKHNELKSFKQEQESCTIQYKLTIINLLRIVLAKNSFYFLS